MPLHWKIAPLEHMVVAVFEGEVGLDEVLAYFAALDAAGAIYYRKLMDATHGTCRFSEGEIARLAAQAGAFDRSGTPGPMAVVTGAAGNDPFVTNLRALTPKGRRLRTFSNIHEARRWLGRMAPGRPPG